MEEERWEIVELTSNQVNVLGKRYRYDESTGRYLVSGLIRGGDRVDLLPVDTVPEADGKTIFATMLEARRVALKDLASRILEITASVRSIKRLRDWSERTA